MLKEVSHSLSNLKKMHLPTKNIEVFNSCSFGGFFIFLKVESQEAPDILNELFRRSMLSIIFSTLTVSVSKTSKYDFAKDVKFCI